MKPTRFGLAFYGSKTLKMWKRRETIKVPDGKYTYAFFWREKVEQ